MNTRYKIALATLAGIGIGAAAIHELHAQAKPPAYVVVAVRSIKDADAFKAGVIDKGSPAVLAAAGGRSVPKQSEASTGLRPSASFSLLSTAWRRRWPGTTRRL
jgi:hypothetical protein